MNRLYFLAPIAVTLLVLAGCSGTGLPESVSPQSIRALGASSEELFVANQVTVTVYAVNGKLLRRISTGLSAPTAMAIDANRNLYVANRGNSTVTVYGAGTTTLLRTISSGVSHPRALAFDRQGNLYVGNKGNGNGTGTVTVYAPQQHLPIRTIVHVDPHVLTFDRYDRLYVGSPGLNEILVYEPRSVTPYRIVHTHNGPLAVGIGDNEYLYCVNNNSVTIYAPSATSPTRRITKGINLPSALALFAKRLYVANWGVIPTQSSVTSYALKNLTPAKTIRAGIGNPLALVVDRAGNLFVANDAFSTVTIYAAGKTAPLRTISTGIRGPVALAVTP
jgi:YVTN family beta-propeller protein